MARCCGGSGTCACKVQAARHVNVTGIGSAQDPFVIAVQTELGVLDNEQFNLTLYGEGTLESPWILSVQYAETAGLDGLPNVNVTGATNAQVLAYDQANDVWVPAPPAVAPPGAVSVGNGLDGDGSGGDPLIPVPNAARFIQVTADGIGLNDAGINRLIRVFATSVARDNANPAAVEGTLSILQTDPSRIDYFDGVDWLPVTGGIDHDIDGQFLARSGPYVAGGPVTLYVRQLAGTTDGTGAFVVLDADDLAEYAGVVSVRVTPTGAGTAWVPMLTAGGGIVSAVARRASDGTPLTGANVTGIVEATLY